MMLRPVQFSSSSGPRFGAAEPTDNDVALSKQISAADQQHLMQLRLYELELQKCREAGKDVEHQVKLYDNISQGFGTGALATAAGLMGAWSFGLIQGPLGWALGGLAPLALLAVPATKRLLSASEKLNSYFA